MTYGSQWRTLLCSAILGMLLVIGCASCQPPTEETTMVIARLGEDLNAHHLVVDLRTSGTDVCVVGNEVRRNETLLVRASGTKKCDGSACHATLRVFSSVNFRLLVEGVNGVTIAFDREVAEGPNIMSKSKGSTLNASLLGRGTYVFKITGELPTVVPADKPVSSER